MLHVELVHELGGIQLDIDVDVSPGACLALAGPSGAGKTTALRAIAGTMRPDRGRISNGEDLWADTATGVWWPPERRRCGYVFQDYALFPHLSAWRNVAYGLRSMPSKRRREIALELLERFELGGRANARPEALSGGERQRVALARALAPRPSALLLDEPLSALDARTRASAARQLVSTLRSLEVPVVLVTHEFSEASLLGDEICVMDQGRIVQRGTATELAAAPASAFVASFAGAVILTGTARASDGELTIVDLDGGGAAWSTDRGNGRVAMSVYPWEITISESPNTVEESALNRLTAQITSITAVGNRVRLGLAAGQPLVAEITGKATEDLNLAVGREVIASWKATATRLVTL